MQSNDTIPICEMIQTWRPLKWEFQILMAITPPHGGLQSNFLSLLWTAREVQHKQISQKIWICSSSVQAALYKGSSCTCRKEYFKKGLCQPYKHLKQIYSSYRTGISWNTYDDRGAEVTYVVVSSKLLLYLFGIYSCSLQWVFSRRDSLAFSRKKWRLCMGFFSADHHIFVKPNHGKNLLTPPGDLALECSDGHWLSWR